MNRKAQILGCSLLATVVGLSIARACPFCTVESSTLAEEMDASDAVVLATLVEPSTQSDTGPDQLGEFGVVDPDTGRATFRITEVLAGKQLLDEGQEIEAIFFGEPVDGQLYFIRGVGVDTVDWNIPMPVSTEAVEYIKQVRTLPPNGPERMEYFLQYLQHEDPLLAQDAYDEFARAPYSEVVAIKDQIDREQLWKWIEDREVSPSRRSLFFTMLGVSGEQEDIKRLESLMLADVRVLRSAAEATAAAGLGLGGAISLPIVPEMVAMDGRRKQLGFNALVGCYLKLTGSAGLDVVDERFLKDPYADPTKVYGVLIALRFMGEETDDLPQDRLLESMRLVLDKPDFAEQAITDLARWEDWSVLDRLVDMYKDAPARTYVKEPIVAYLDQASHQPGDVGQRATAALEELEELDPETVKRARSLMSFGFLARARTATPASGVASDQSEKNGKDDPSSDVASSDAAESAAATDDDATEATAQTQQVDATQEVAIDPDEATTAAEAVAASESDSSVAKTKTPTAVPATTPATAGAAPAPPNRMLVLAVPLLAAAGFAAILWVVLRGGV